MNEESPLLVQFWAMSCPVCKFNMPQVQRIRDEYAPHGLQLISIHMPRGEFDLDIERVRQAMQEMNMTEPCAIDNDHVIGDRFDTGGMWPYYFLFDAQHKLRCKAAGPTGLKMVESALKRMIARQEGAHENASQMESVTA